MEMKKSAYLAEQLFDSHLRLEVDLGQDIFEELFIQLQSMDQVAMLPVVVSLMSSRCAQPFLQTNLLTRSRLRSE